MAAANALGNIGDRKALGSLIEDLEDEYWNVEQAAATALGNLHDIRAIMPLIRTLGEGAFPSVRTAAATALSKLGEKKWENIVKGEIEDYNRLGSSGDRRAIEPLLKALNDKDPNIRIHAASALAILDDENAIKPLGNAYETETDKNVKTAIVSTIKQLQEKI